MPLLVASTAYADVGPPVAIRLSRATTAPAVSGQDYGVTVEIVVGGDGTIDSFAVGGEGWTINKVSFGTPHAVKAGETIPVAIQGRPTDAEKALDLTVTFNGRSISKAFHLSAKRFEQASKGGRSARIDGQDPVAAAAAALARPERQFTDHPREGGENPAPRGGSIHLHMRGRIVYQRTDGLILGADTLSFSIMDEDDFSDEEMHSGFTDQDGNFDVEFDWDDCDVLGCDVPDIYLRYFTDNGIAKVEDGDFFGQPFIWTTKNDVYNDFPGDFLDFGTIMPADLNQHQAIHISNSITRAHRYIQSIDGTNVVGVSIKWPEPGTGAFYDPGSGDIHISSNREWDEITHTHEYGHHFANHYSILSTPSYCNGICDSGSCGHCVWCPEDVTDAWNEGWPDWFGSLVIRKYPAAYGYAAWSAATDSLFNLEGTFTCGVAGAPVNVPATEGFTSALLYDMDDTANEGPFGAGGCTADAMSGCEGKIFQVIRLDRPTTVAEFITDYGNRFPLEIQDFWSTCRNIDSTFSFSLSSPPVIVSQTPHSCELLHQGQSLQLTVQGNGAWLHYQWRRNGVPLTNTGIISGATTPTLSIDTVTSFDNGAYDCVVKTCDETLSTTSTVYNVHVFAAGGGGTQVSGFGRNDLGQLGNGSLEGTFFNGQVREVANLTNAVKVAAGYWHTIALKSDGTVWAWGNNNHGEIGQGISNGNYPQATQVPGLTDIVDIAACGFSIALKGDGTVWVWGDNAQLQNGTAVPGYWAWNAVPTRIPELSCVVGVAAAGGGGFALMADGTVASWGLEVGLYPNQYTRVPLPVANLTNVVAISSHCGGHAMALKSDGTVWAWGANGFGQLGDGTFTDRAMPAPVQGLSGVTKIKATAGQSMALLVDQSVRVWGDNNGGQVGNGSNSQHLTAPITPVGMDHNVIDMDADAYNYTCMYLKTDGSIWTCGQDSNGQLGHPPFGDNIPHQVTLIPFPVSAVCGGGGIYMMQHAPTPPYVDQAPIPATALAGGRLVLHAGAHGTPPLTFQWFTDSGPLSDNGRIHGANTPDLIIDPVAMSDAGNYRLGISNAQGLVLSNPAAASVIPSPFCDTFTGGASNLWQHELGNWIVTNGVYSASNNASAYSTLPFQLADLSADLDFVNADSGGIWLRTVPGLRGVLLYDTGGSLAWYTYLNNTFTGPINSASNVYAIGGAFHVRVEVTGNNYRAFVNGSPTPITQLTTPDYAIGVIALRGGSNQGFDSVCISTGGAAPHDGDLNGDGGANGRDVGMFSAAIIAGSMDPNLLLHADFNGNGVMDPGDVSGFLALLLGQ